MTSPRISVICPVFNRSRRVLDTIDSVRAQTVTDWELLVVSDGSTDDTERWVAQAARSDPRVTLHRTGPHGHPSEPRNVGLQLARGEVVAYIDHDDRWHRDHLAEVLTAIDHGVELVATGFERRDGHGRTVGTSDTVTLCWHPQIQLVSPLFEPSVTAHRRGLPERVGGWRSGVGLEDWDLWVRLADAGHAFTAVPARTAILHYDADTRRHRTARRYRLPLVSFQDARAAAGSLAALRSGRHVSALLDAAVADVVEWLGRLARTAEFRWPLGWRGDLAAEVAATARSDRQAWAQDLVLTPERDRFLISQALWCSTAEHAARVIELIPTIQPRQLDLIARIAADFGGVPAWPMKE